MEHSSQPFETSDYRDFPTSGFDFGLCQRNAFLKEKNPSMSQALTKTGTTIAGLVFDSGVVLGADTRSTSGSTVADPECDKVHIITKNIGACGAGTAADCDFTTKLIGNKLRLYSANTGLEAQVGQCAYRLKHHLFQYQGHVSAALVLGGVDRQGPQLYMVHPHGSTDPIPYGSMGSGSLAATAVLEANYRDHMGEEDAKQLIAQAIRAGIFNDLGSGSHVDLLIIRRTADGIVQQEHIRHYQSPNSPDAIRAQYQRPTQRLIPRGATRIISETVEIIE